jgi:AcrR family transcriptional regulator
MTPRTQPPEQRRAALLDAAQKVLLDKGIDGLTVDDITAAAGVAKGTFYLYFRSKEQVLAAVRDQWTETTMQRQAAAVDELPAGDWTGRLERWMETSIRAYQQHFRLHDALFHGSHDQPTPESRPHAADVTVNPHAQALEHLLEAGTAAGAFHLDSPRTAAILLYSAMHGAADYLIGPAGARPSDDLATELIAELRQLCRRYVSAGGS